MFRKKIYFISIFLFFFHIFSFSEIIPPKAKKIPKKIKIHGVELIDNYFWLRNLNKDPDVLKYLNAENSYTDSIMASTKDIQDKLFREMISRIKETDESLPEKKDNFYYYSRTVEGLQYEIYCRKENSLEAPEEIILDLNKLAGKSKYFALGDFKVSPNHQILAYSIDTNGSEKYNLYFKDLKSGKILKDIIKNVSDIEWLNDNKTIIYLLDDASGRPAKVYKHIIGTPVTNDKLLYNEKDAAFFCGIFKTKSKKYIILEIGSKMTSEAYYFDANNQNDNFHLINKRIQGLEYYVEDYENNFLILNNENAKNFKLSIAPISSPKKENWKDFISYDPENMIEGFDVFKNYLVIYERKNGLKKIHIFDKIKNIDYYIDFPEPLYNFWTVGNKEYDTNILRFAYTSFLTPTTIYDFHMDTKGWEMKKKYEVLGGYNPQNYKMERIFAKADDGTLIPISLVYRRDLIKDGKNPLFLYAYGAYGSNEDIYFSSTYLSLLDRGFIYAIAHIRGGGDMGKDWYENGKLLKKKNTFTDFINCAEFLIKEKYTSNEKLIINGGSAGGLLMGAVTNMRPDLFKAVIADVPFVDLINTMLDPSLPLTVTEYEEWGNPNNKEYFDYMLSYSPYDNIEKKAYPNMLVTGGLNDPRVSYWEPAKYVAKLREMKTDNNLLLLKIDMSSGHSGSSGRYDYYKQLAFTYAFIFKVLGIKE